MRVPTYWTFFFFAILSIGLAFQGDNYLFDFIGININFNVLARIGLLVFAIWFSLLGIRGHGIFWSSFPISYADFNGGYGLFYGLFGLGLFLIFFSAFSTVQIKDHPSETFSYTSSSTPHPTNSPPKPTKHPIAYNGISCVPWKLINESDIESYLCVYGKVHTYGPYSNKWNTIQFSSKTDAFRVIDFNYSHATPLQIGDCVVVYGRIRDYGLYLIISPDFNTSDPIDIYSSSYCD